MPILATPKFKHFWILANIMLNPTQFIIITDDAVVKSWLPGEIGIIFTIHNFAKKMIPVFCNNGHKIRPGLSVIPIFQTGGINPVFPAKFFVRHGIGYFCLSVGGFGNFQLFDSLEGASFLFK